MLLERHLNVLKSRLEEQMIVHRANVEISAGRFDLAELTHTGFRAPAVRIAFLGAGKSSAQANEEREFEAAFSAFVVTEGARRGEEGRAILSEIAAAITLWHSGVRGTGLPKNLRIDALSTFEIERRAVALYAVSWTQNVRLGVDEVGAGVHDPAALPVAGAEADTTIAEVSNVP